MHTVCCGRSEFEAGLEPRLGSKLQAPTFIFLVKSSSVLASLERRRHPSAPIPYVLRKVPIGIRAVTKDAIERP